MASSVTVEARKHLIDELQELISEDEALITYGWRADTRERNQIFTQRSRGETPPASLKAGKKFRNEQARFSLVIHVHKVGASQEEADEDAIAFGLVVEDYFAENSSPGVDGLNWWRVESYELDGGPTDRASVSQLIYTILYDARLT